MFIHSAWNIPAPAKHRLFVLGAGFSKAAFDPMPVAAALEASVLEATGLGALPTPSLESTLAYLAEEHPFDRADEPPRRRLMMVQAIRAIAHYIAVRQDEGLADGLPSWVGDYVASWTASGAFVASFNYDLFVEKTADKFGFGYRDSTSVRTFSLLKPHGSLDLSWMPGKPGTIYETAGDHSTLLSDRGKGREPFIVPPTTAKSSFYGTDALVPAWQSLRYALETAEEIVFVGYSVAEADSTVNGLLSLRVGRATVHDGLVLKPENRVVVVDHDPGAVADRLARLGLIVDPVDRFKSVEAYSRRLLGEVLQEGFHDPLTRLVRDQGDGRLVSVKSDSLVTGIEVTADRMKALLRTAKTLPFEDPSAKREWKAADLSERLAGAERIETDDALLVTHFSQMEEGDRLHLTLLGARDTTKQPNAFWPRTFS